MSRFNLSAWAVAHPSLMFFLIVMLGVAGLFSYRSLGRAEDPSFTIKLVVVTAMWPGATAAEMQTQVADPIEKKLQELPYFDKVTTYNKPAFTAMQVAFKDNTPARDVPQLFYQLRKKISDIKDDLPAGLIGPSINDEYGDVDSILYMITSDGADYAQMKKVAEAFRQRLLKVKNVTKVNLYGTQDEKIYVEFSNAKLATLGITTDQLFQSLARQNAVVPAGVLETTAQRVPLRVTGALDGAKAVAETPVEANGRVFRVGDIATVTHGYPDPPDFLVRQRGKAAIGVGVVMAKGANILELGPAVAARPPISWPRFHKASISSRSPISRSSSTMRSTSSSIPSSKRWRSCCSSAFSRSAGAPALSWRCPCRSCSAVVFIVMNAMGLDLHRITLGALIIALGLLVDDAIIAVEMMVVKMEQGWDRIRAASFAWESTAFPMLTGTLVTAAGFLPIGFANSSVGEYAGGIFWVVAIALLASWVVAVVFTPYIGVKLLPNIKPLEPGHDPHEIYETRMYRALRRVIEWCVKRRITVVLVTDRHLRAVDRGLRPRAAAILPAVGAARAVLSAPHAGRHGVRYDARNRSRRRKHCSRAITIFPPTPPMSAAARRGSGSASIHSCPTSRSPRSWSCRRTSRRGSGSRRGSKRRSRTARCRRRACGSIGSISGRRSASRCSSASSVPTRKR